METFQRAWQLLLEIVLFYQVNQTNAIYECKAGTWGAQCGNQCGHCVGGGEFCQVFDGRCMNGCASGYYGQLCKRGCYPGKFGPYCMEKCGKCTGGNIRCDFITGHCENGCEAGYQLPFCKLPCQFRKYGRDCAKSCQCPENCGCKPETGECILNGCDPAKVKKNRKDSSSRECINQYALKEVIDQYAPPDVLEIPWQSMLSVIGVLFAFVSGNFLWWWFMVRRPAAPKDDVQIDRGERPDYLAATQEEKSVSIVLAREKRRIAMAEVAAAEAAKNKRRIFPFSLPSFIRKKSTDSQEREKTLAIAGTTAPSTEATISF